MNINAISQGVILNLISNTILVFFLVHYQFNMTEEWFTACLIFVLFLISLYVGVISARFGQLNGSMVGIISALILFAFIAQFVDMNWVLNGWIGSAWLTVGYIGGAVGSKFLKSKKAKD